MKRTWLTSSMAVLLALAAVPVSADGLLYQLPPDGEWVLYDMRVQMSRGEETRDAIGTLRMSSVGRAEANGQQCRWIEFHMKLEVDGADRTVVAKVLIPESDLTEGRMPLKNRARGWVRIRADGEIQELTNDNVGPLPTFLANPLTDVKQLEAKSVNSKLGELPCAGLTGRTEFVEGPRNNTVTFETRRHKNAPFGVVTSAIKIEISSDGAPIQKLDMDLKLSDLGKSAASELPDHQ